MWAILVSLLVLTSLLLPAGSLYVVFWRLRRRGYPPTVAGSMLAVVSILALLLAWVKGAGAWTCSAVAPAAVLLLCAMPSRHAWRRRGRSLPRFPYAAFALLWLSAAALFGLKLVVDFDSGVLLFGLLFFWLGSLFWYLRARATAGGRLPQALDADPRSPVLYLRPFSHDGDIFMFPPPHLKHLKTRSAVTSMSFEEFFAREIEKTIGPFIALGSPEDYLVPEGAARGYFSDAKWQDEVKKLIRQACLVIMEVADSANLAWELAQLRQSGDHRKLVLLTRPRWSVPPKLSFARPYMAFARWARGVRTPSWLEFTTTMAQHGLRLPSDQAPPGSAFGFDARGDAVLLTTHAADPEDYCLAMAAWRDGRLPSVRMRQVRCSRCALAAWVPGDDVSAPSLCESCKRHVGLAVMHWRQRFGALLAAQPLLMYAYVGAIMLLAPALVLAVFVSIGPYWPEDLDEVGFVALFLLLIVLLGLFMAIPAQPNRRRRDALSSVDRSPASPPRK